MTDESGCAFVSSHLVVGAVPSKVAGPFVLTQDLTNAVQGLQNGATVVLPQGEFDLAEAVLLAAGATPEHARFSRLYAEGALPVREAIRTTGNPTSAHRLESP